MIYFDNEYKFSTTKIHYKEEQEGEVIKFIPESKEYWENLAENGIIEIIGFEEEDNYNKDQRARLDIVNSLKIQEGTPLVEEYIVNGKFSKIYEDEDGNKVRLSVTRDNPLWPLKIESELIDAQNLLLELNINNLIGGANNEFSL